ncbi:MAG TPA: YdeI/OmpD-associated family protein [Thermoanaerobaculia bacterium]|nr:YdeI/OmpD-associated family protein [Thermoanaerobaculia bacterium]
MQPAGLRAFEARTAKKSGVYAYENAPKELAPEYEKTFRANKKAWEYFNAQPPGYRRLAIYYVMGAKREETRARRLALLIEDSAAGRRLAAYTLEKRKD